MDSKGFPLFIDNEEYFWEHEAITGAQLRTLGAIPEGVDIFLQVPGQPDEPISNSSVINLERRQGPPRFSTQSPGSQAG